MNSRRNGPQAVRFADRRRREDEAPRLCDQAPKLVNLQLEIEDRCGGVVEGSRHMRKIVIERAPALFLVPCGDLRCMGEEHDLTSAVMRALHSGQTSFRGEDECRGSVGPAACGRVLRFEASAAYRP